MRANCQEFYLDWISCKTSDFMNFWLDNRSVAFEFIGKDFLCFWKMQSVDNGFQSLVSSSSDVEWNDLFADLLQCADNPDSFFFVSDVGAKFIHLILFSQWNYGWLDVFSNGNNSFQKGCCRNLQNPCLASDS